MEIPAVLPRYLLPHNWENLDPLQRCEWLTAAKARREQWVAEERAAGRLGPATHQEQRIATIEKMIAALAQTKV